MRERRLFLVALVLLTVLLTGILNGCATPDVICNIRLEEQTKPIAVQGQVRSSWTFNSALPAKPAFGDTTCWQQADGMHCNSRFNFPPPSVNDICGLARIGAEVFHQWQGEHAR